MATPNAGQARQAIHEYLVGELWGQVSESPSWAHPLPAPDALGVVRLTKNDKTTYFDSETGEPIVQGLRPEYQFGAGILHAPELTKPSDTKAGKIEDEDSEETTDLPDNFSDSASSTSFGSEDGDEFGLTLSQRKKPSAMGLTFQAHLNAGDSLNITVTGARYESVKVAFESEKESIWYRRAPFTAAIDLQWSDLASSPNTLLTRDLGLPLSDLVGLQIRWRPSKTLDTNGHPLASITVVLKHLGTVNEDIFQVGLTATVEGSGFIGSPDRARFVEISDHEQEELELLYRHTGTFARGHGMAASWDLATVSPEMTVKSVTGSAVPTFHQEVLSTAVEGLELSMQELAACSDQEDLRVLLSPLVEGYSNWIENQIADSGLIPRELVSASGRLVAKANRIRERMQHGLIMLVDRDNEAAFEAFKIANRAMYDQQRSGKLSLRKFVDDPKTKLEFGQVEEPTGPFGYWRPFQVGFILMSISGIIDELEPSRDEVDLIFFPTGGGKTEAYLGLAAFTIAYRRLTNPQHDGVDVLMRYTLRLLTIQQFERSAALIVALESLRRRDSRLGSAPITIGVWLGASTTDNSKEAAIKSYNNAAAGKETTNRFLLSRCPKCAAQIGLGKKRGWVGIRSNKASKTISFVCPDRNCEFSFESSPLPIHVIDEEVYENRPSFILGTVDKFARLAWVPEARAIFNLDSDGQRMGLPPALIIQDELHLISGPLGSMVGLYEPVIQALSTYEKNGKIIRPKIVASTATTRKYEQQIRSLYGNRPVTLFPQALNRVNETYFSSIELDQEGQPVKGTLYVGLNPATITDTQMAASRVAAALSQAPNAWDGPREPMDFYQTSMWFFNSLKDLGMTLTLFQSVVIDVISGMGLYRRLPRGEFRPIRPIKELTGRIQASEVAESLTELERNSWDEGFIRTCLASSIMEVGVDVQRLGLLTIMGQPKSTSQYIQISGRVGRAREHGPGLVVMLYNAGRARDRSVYENFLSYHQRLYAQVEPVSATPFAIESMKHGLVGALISYYRSAAKTSATATTPVDEIYENAVRVLRQRLQEITTDPVKITDFEKQVQSFLKKWKKYEPTKWNYSSQKEKNNAPDDIDTALMRARREPIADLDDQSELVPTSLRNVDGQTQLRPVANPYQEVSDEQ